MATRLPAVRCAIQWLDGSGSRTSSICYRQSSEPIAAVDAAAMGLVATVQAASNCAVEEYTATWSFHVGDTRPAPGGAPASQGAVWVFGTATEGEYVMFSLPGVPETYIFDGEIDITQPDIAAIGEFIISAGLENPFGVAATELLYVVPTAK